MHEEMPEPVDGRMEGFQLWVNLPARLKMTGPALSGDRSPPPFPVVYLRQRWDGRSRDRRFGGGRAGPVTDIFAEPEYLDVTLRRGARFEQPVTQGHNACWPMRLRGRGDVRGWHGGARQRRSWSSWATETSCDAHAGANGLRFLLVIGRAARRTDRALRPVRDEHARGDPAGAGGSPRRNLRAILRFDTIPPRRWNALVVGSCRAVRRPVRHALYTRLLRIARVCPMALLLDRRLYSGLSTATSATLPSSLEVQTPAIGLRQRRRRAYRPEALRRTHSRVQPASPEVLLEELTGAGRERQTELPLACMYRALQGSS